jgi:hypothetical protein
MKGNAEAEGRDGKRRKRGQLLYCQKTDVISENVYVYYPYEQDVRCSDWFVEADGGPETRARDAQEVAQRIRHPPSSH